MGHGVPLKVCSGEGCGSEGQAQGAWGWVGEVRGARGVELWSWISYSWFVCFREEGGSGGEKNKGAYRRVT